MRIFLILVISLSPSIAHAQHAQQQTWDFAAPNELEKFDQKDPLGAAMWLCHRHRHDVGSKLDLKPNWQYDTGYEKCDAVRQAWLKQQADKTATQLQSDQSAIDSALKAKP